MVSPYIQYQYKAIEALLEYLYCPKAVLHEALCTSSVSDINLVSPLFYEKGFTFGHTPMTPSTQMYFYFIFSKWC